MGSIKVLWCVLNARGSVSLLILFVYCLSRFLANRRRSNNFILWKMTTIVCLWKWGFICPMIQKSLKLEILLQRKWKLKNLKWRSELGRILSLIAGFLTKKIFMMHKLRLKYLPFRFKKTWTQTKYISFLWGFTKSEAPTTSMASNTNKSDHGTESYKSKLTELQNKFTLKFLGFY